MLFLTLLLIVSVPLVLEVFVAPRVWFWRAIRWPLVPPLGGLLGALFPMNVLPVHAGIDSLLSLALGAMMGALMAIYGIFRENCFTGMSMEQIAKSGRRSAYRGPVRI